MRSRRPTRSRRPLATLKIDSPALILPEYTRKNASWPEYGSVIILKTSAEKRAKEHKEELRKVEQNGYVCWEFTSPNSGRKFYLAEIDQFVVVSDSHELVTESLAKKAGKKIIRIKEGTIAMLQGYEWPGNVRELQNVIERAVILCADETLSVSDTWLKRTTPRLSGFTGPLVATLADREREVIEAALADSQGRISGPSGAAAKLGIPRQTLDSKIANLQISKSRFKVQSIS